MRRWWLLTALCSGALLIFLFQGRGCDPGGGNLVKESNVERPVGGNPVARRPTPAARRSSLGDLADRDPSRLALRKHSWSDEVKLEIVVTDRSDGTAVEHAEVRVSQPTMDFLSEGFTDLSGVATSRLMAGVYRVEIDKSGFLPEAFDLQVPAGRAQLRTQVELTEAAVLEGSVVNQHGRPVAGAQISVGLPQGGDNRRARRNPLPSAQSQADGSFLRLLEPGSYTLKAVKRPHSPGTTPLLTLVPGTNPPVQLQIEEVDQVVDFWGMVVDQDERPVAGALVRIGSERILNSVKTDDQGSFRMQTTPMPWAYVDVRASGYRRESRRIQLQRGTSARFTLKGDQFFSVRVLDRSGREIEDARVHGESMEHRAHWVLRTEDGRFYAKQYPFWIYADAFRSGQGMTELRLVESYQPEIHLFIETGGGLQGRVTDANGLPVTSFTLSLQFSGRRPVLSQSVQSQDGSFQFRDLWPGPVTLSIKAPGRQKTNRRVSLRAGQMEWVEIVMEPPPPNKE